MRISPVDILIPTYGQPDKTLRCLDSVRDCTDDYRVVWVDNGSSGRSRDVVLERLASHPDYVSIWSAGRLGFVGAVNLGLKVSMEALPTMSEYVVLLNNDVVVSPGWLDRMVGVLESEPSVFAVGPVTGECQSWQSFLNVGGVLPVFQVPDGFAELGLAGRAEKLAYCCGDLWRPCRMLAFFCTVFRKEVFRKVGYLDPGFEEGLGDDDDMSRRMADAGMARAVSLGTYVHHDHRSTFAAIFSDRELEDMRDRHLGVYRRKHGEDASVR
jgi:GT2 family glycosyltransferase